MSKNVLRTALIGLGKISHGYEDDPFVCKRMLYPTHFSVLRSHPAFKLIAAADINSKARQEFNKKVYRDGIVIYKNWQELFKKEKIDLVVVSTDTQSHIEICKGALNFKIPYILCEKPISYSVSESRQLISDVRKKKTVFTVNYIRAFQPSYQKFINSIHKEEFGRLQTFNALYSRGIFNNGTHMIDLLLRMFGKVKNVTGESNPTISRSLQDVTVSFLLQFNNGVSGYVHGLNHNYYNMFLLELFFENAVVKINNDYSEIYISSPSKLVKNYFGLKKIKSKENLTDVRQGLYPVYENIYRHITKGEKLLVSGEQACDVLSVTDKAIKSYKNNI